MRVHLKIQFKTCSFQQLNYTCTNFKLTEVQFEYLTFGPNIKFLLLFTTYAFQFSAATLGISSKYVTEEVIRWLLLATFSTGFTFLCQKTIKTPTFLLYMLVACSQKFWEIWQASFMTLFFFIKVFIRYLKWENKQLKNFL